MPFDNLNNIQSRKLNLALLILFTFLAMVATVFLPFLGFVTAALLPVPTVLLILSNRLRDGIICAIAGIIVFFILDYSLAITILVLLIAFSIAYRHFLNKNKKTFFSITIIFLIFLGAILLYAAINFAISGGTLFKDLIKNYSNVVNNLSNDPIVKTYQSLTGADSQQINLILNQMKSILNFIPYLIPAIIIVLLGAAAIINYYGTSVILKRYNITLGQLPDLKIWDLPWYLCWGVILGIIFVILPQVSSNFGKIINASGYSLIIIFGALYLVLGIAVIRGLFERFKTGIYLRLIILAIVVFAPGLIVLIPLIGLIDIWANFRKLKRS